jgi:hypothetical protein
LIQKVHFKKEVKRLRIVVKQIPTSFVREIPETAREAMIGLELETSEYNSPWLRLGDINLAINDDNFYTVSYRNLFLALNKKNPNAARDLSFCISSEIKFILLEKSFCKEK